MRRDDVEADLPEDLLDYLQREFNVATDGELAIVLQISSSYLSKLRNKKMHLTAWFILKVYDNTDMSVEDIRSLAGVKKEYQNGREETSSST